MTPNLKGALEENVLAVLGWSDQHAPALMLKLDHKIFSTRSYRDIAAAAIAHITKYGAAPRGHLYDLLEAPLSRGAEGRLMRVTLDQMQELAADMQADYVMDQLAHFIELREMMQSVERASDALQNGDTVKAREALAAQPVARNQSEGIWLSDPKQALSFLDVKEEDFFPTGVGVLDDMGVRPERKTLFLFIAPPKKGKSWFLVGAGLNALHHRRKILHITLEMSAKRTAQRYVQALTARTQSQAKSIRVPYFTKLTADDSIRIDYDERLYEGMSVSDKPELAKKLRALKKRAPLLIKDFPSGSLTVAQLDSYLALLLRTEKFVPDEIVLDYADLMSIDSANVRSDTGRLFVNLRGFADRHDLALTTATQGNRGSSTAAVVGTGHVAEDWSKIMTADTIITYSQTSEEKKHGLARLFVAATRNVRDGYMVLISQSYETGQFCLDSVMMNHDVADEMKRITGDGSNGDRS